MARIELIIPKMGESVSEATIISWAKELGDVVEIDETILEIATDKVDSEIPSTHSGKLVEKLFEADDVVQVGQAFAILENDQEEGTKEDSISEKGSSTREDIQEESGEINKDNEIIHSEKDVSKENNIRRSISSERFYSPLVKSIALEEEIDLNELDKISGTGQNGRVTKSDIISYVEARESKTSTIDATPNKTEKNTVDSSSTVENVKQTSSSSPFIGQQNTEIIEMDRMRKLISAHMTMSKQTSAHITSFVEADMTNIVKWRNKIKSSFKEKEGQNITFTPIIIEAMAKAIKDFPMINVSVEGTNIHVHKNINIGMAAALPDGNLIVPVIKQCQDRSLIGITKSVNDLATRARSGKLDPDDIQGGTITMTNVGTFGNLMGTPIINQPQVAIMACGVIKKKPVVMETEVGDVIAIRNMMYLSLSYDHRVVDGSLGGQFVKKVADYLENFDVNQMV